MGKAITGFIVILIVVAPCSASFPFKDYAKLKTAPWFTRYIGGVGTGFEVANATLTNEGRPPLYCQPPRLALDEHNYTDILDRQVNSGAQYKDGIPVETILLQGLRETFTCTSAESTIGSQDRLPQTQPLRFGATLNDPRSKATMGCVGALEVSASRFAWIDTELCWSGREVSASLQDLVWINYEIWNIGTSADFQLREYPTQLGVSLPGSAPAKLYRLISRHSPSTVQRCSLGSLDAKTEKVLQSIPCAQAFPD